MLVLLLHISWLNSCIMNYFFLNSMLWDLKVKIYTSVNISEAPGIVFSWGSSICEFDPVSSVPFGRQRSEGDGTRSKTGLIAQYLSPAACMHNLLLFSSFRPQMAAFVTVVTQSLISLVEIIMASSKGFAASVCVCVCGCVHVSVSE